jgi:phage-related tail fiber protein
MAGTNDFKAVATGVGANVITQSAYAALTSFLANGYSSGVVASDQFNKIIRQSSFIAAAIGQIVADAEINAVDDGDVPGFVADLISAFRSFSPPPGTVIHVAMNTAPTGFLKANGAAISRTTYASLFAAIGTTFGAGNGATTFNVPDLRGEFLRGWDDGRGIDGSRVFGSLQKGTLVAWDDNNNGVFSVSHNASTATAATTQALVGADAYTASDYNSTLDLKGITHSASNTLPGGGGGGWSGVVRPRNVSLLACIKY